jgi:hypothetical protein
MASIHSGKQRETFRPRHSSPFCGCRQPLLFITVGGGGMGGMSPPTHLNQLFNSSVQPARPASLLAYRYMRARYTTSSRCFPSLMQRAYAWPQSLILHLHTGPRSLASCTSDYRAHSVLATLLLTFQPAARLTYSSSSSNERSFPRIYLYHA